MRNFSDNCCRENQNTYFTFNVFPPRKSYPLWDNVEKCGTLRLATDGNTIRRMRFALWIPKAANTHSEYVILIAFPLQQWLTNGKPRSRVTGLLLEFLTLEYGTMRRDSSVSIVTRSGVDGPGIESRWGGEIFRTRPDRPLGPTQPPVQWVPGISRR